MARVANLANGTGCASTRVAPQEVARAEMREAATGSSTARATMVSETQMTAAARTIVSQAIARIRRSIEFSCSIGERVAVAVRGYLFLAADSERQSECDVGLNEDENEGEPQLQFKRGADPREVVELHRRFQIRQPHRAANHNNSQYADRERVVKLEPGDQARAARGLIGCGFGGRNQHIDDRELRAHVGCHRAQMQPHQEFAADHRLARSSLNQTTGSKSRAPVRASREYQWPLSLTILCWVLKSQYTIPKRCW